MRGLHIAPGLVLPLDAATQTFGIVAKRGVGKTYTALVMAEEMFGAGLPFVFVDPMGVCWGLRASADGRGPGLPILVLGGEHGDVPLEPTAGEVIAEFVVQERQSVVLDISLFRKGEQVRFATDFAEYIYHHNRKPLHIFLDEADMFAPQKPYKGQERMLGATEDLVRRGRARGIGLTMCTQRAAVLNKDVLTQVEVLITLRTLSPQDQAAAEAWVKAKGLGKHDEYMASLADLPIGTAWFWSPGWLDLFKRVQVRKRTTFNSSATPKVGQEAVRPKKLAEVNITKLASDISASIERAKENDPRELRKKIAELQARMAQMSTALDNASEHPQSQVQYVDRSVLTDADKAFLSEALDAINDSADDLRATGEKIREHAKLTLGALEEDANQTQAAADKLIEASVRISKAAAGVQAIPANLIDPKLRLSGLSRAGGTVHIVPRREKSPEQAMAEGFDRMVLSGVTSSGEVLRAGERKMLEAAYRRYPLTMSRSQLGTLSGFAPRGGTFGTYFGRLKRFGYLQETNDELAITDKGIAYFGGQKPDPQTAEEVRNMWRAVLRRGERAMFDYLVSVYPKSATREEVGQSTGFAPSGGTFGTYLGVLRRNGLVDTDGYEVRASPSLF